MNLVHFYNFISAFLYKLSVIAPSPVYAKTKEHAVMPMLPLTAIILLSNENLYFTLTIILDEKYNEENRKIQKPKSSFCFISKPVNFLVSEQFSNL
jgi:hypothetical protein